MSELLAQSEQVALPPLDESLENMYLTFFCDRQLFAVSVKTVVQIIGVQAITAVPEFPHYAKGIINLRGSIVPVVDIRLRFGKPTVPYTDRTCIIIALIGDMEIGFIVDEVDEVLEIGREQITGNPRNVSGVVSEFVTGIAKTQKGVLLLLDTLSLLSTQDLSFFASSAE